MKSLNSLYILLGTAGIMGVLVMDLISVEEEQINPVKLMFLSLIYIILYKLRI